MEEQFSEDSLPPGTTKNRHLSYAEAGPSGEIHHQLAEVPASISRTQIALNSLRHNLPNAMEWLLSRRWFLRYRLLRWIWLSRRYEYQATQKNQRLDRRGISCPNRGRSSFVVVNGNSVCRVGSWWPPRLTAAQSIHTLGDKAKRN